MPDHDSTPSTELTQAPNTAPSRVPLKMGLAPQSVEEAWRLAGFLAASELVPKAYRGKQADVLVAIQFGLELGFLPMQSLQSIAVINGRPSIWGDGLLALILGSPLYKGHDECFEVAGERRDGLTAADLQQDDTTAVCTFWRRDKAQPVTRRFSIGQARKAGLLAKDGPWQTYPDRQLAMRARGFAARDAFADVLRGIRAVEEARDTPETPDTADPTPAPITPRRASTSVAAMPELSTRPAVVRTFTNLTVVGATVAEPGGYDVLTQDSTGEARRFSTTDEALYREAASFAGTDHAVVITCHDPGRGAPVIDTLTIDDGTRIAG